MLNKMFFVLMHSRRSVPHSFYHPTTTTSSQGNIIICFFFFFCVDVERMQSHLQNVQRCKTSGGFMCCVYCQQERVVTAAVRINLQRVYSYIRTFFYMPLHDCEKKKLFMQRRFSCDKTTAPPQFFCMHCRVLFMLG